MAEDVRAGLGADPKDLSPWPKYFYDARGSELFEKITAQPEYGQTGAEAGILEDRAAEIVSRARCRELVELGSGSSNKTRTLLDAMTAREGPARYVPLNVSESALEGSARSLLEEYPEPRISGFVGDFEGSLGPLFGRLDGEPRTRLVVFLGGTIGNFTPQQRREFLDRLKAGLRGGDHVLVGVDLVKDASVIEAAYNDAAGVTEAFNKNLLHVLNRELGAGFDPGHFAHRAFYDAGRERVEMWLDSEVEQEVPISALGTDVPFAEGEGVRTEISAKFTRRSAGEMFAGAGLELLELCADPGGLFGLAFDRLSGGAV
jgi:L-histidine N-alpha-methyltransferase